jgi:hypothetical protein
MVKLPKPSKLVTVTILRRAGGATSFIVYRPLIITLPYQASLKGALEVPNCRHALRILTTDHVGMASAVAKIALAAKTALAGWLLSASLTVRFQPHPRYYCRGQGTISHSRGRLEFRLRTVALHGSLGRPVLAVRRRHRIDALCRPRPPRTSPGGVNFASFRSTTSGVRDEGRGASGWRDWTSVFPRISKPNPRERDRVLRG